MRNLSKVISALCLTVACGSPYYEPGRGEPAVRGAGETGSPGEGESGAAGDGPVFAGAGRFASREGGSARNSKHDFEGATPPTNPAGQPCLECHARGGEAPAFAFAGTIYRDPEGAAPAAGVEVRAGGVSAFTDADGNFFARGPVALPSRVGVRSANVAKEMGAPAEEGNCNACHEGGSASRLYVR